MSIGLTWQKLDLHLHTGASHDFVSEVTPQEIVDKAIENDLDAIAITDHNTGAWIDDIKRAAEGTNLTVFPGVEVTCRGGKSGIHILGIFDPLKDSQHIANLLSELGIPADEQGTPEALVSKNFASIEQVIDLIIERDGIAIPAHVNSSKGILTDVRGQQRVSLMQHSGLLAIEATDFHKKPGKRTIDFFNGNNPDYKRKLAVYQASDNPSSDNGGHGLEGIGQRPSYFKLDVVNLEGLRQCFVHPDARIKLAHEDSGYAHIVSLKVGGNGFLKAQDFDFHSGLNSIIGGKGVGKSLVIEFIRFCLGDVSSDDNLKLDHIGKIEKQLGTDCPIELVYRTSSGARYKIETRFLGKRQSKTEINSSTSCINLDTGEKYSGDITELFPILAYSQTEVIKIAESKTAQLDLIDRFIDETVFINRINSLEDKLCSNDQELCISIESKAQLEQIDHELNTTKEKIANIDQLLSNDLFDSMKQSERKQNLLGKNRSALDKAGLSLDNWLVEVGNFVALDVPIDWKEDNDIVEQTELVQAAYATITQQIHSLKLELEKFTARAQNVTDKWIPQFESLTAEYNKLVVGQGADQEELEKKRRSLEHEKNEYEERAQRHRVHAESFTSLNSQRKRLLDQLEQAYRDYYNLRSDKYTELANASGGKLRLTLAHAENIDNYNSRLSELLKGGSNAPSVETRNKVAKSMTPRQFIELVQEKDVGKLAKLAGITELWAERVIDKLWLTDKNFADVLALQHSFFPEDVPNIQYAKSTDTFAGLHELSIGQKCTALLIIAFSEGKIPVLIDQPEDALDIISVWENVTLKLLENKQKRQFILTTHNSSVAVSADSDQFIILGADADKAEILEKGAIDRNEVKKSVINHLEGGAESYRLRQNKYLNSD